MLHKELQITKNTESERNHIFPGKNGAIEYPLPDSQTEYIHTSYRPKRLY